MLKYWLPWDRHRTSVQITQEARCCNGAEGKRIHLTGRCRDRPERPVQLEWFSAHCRRSRTAGDRQFLPYAVDATLQGHSRLSALFVARGTVTGGDLPRKIDGRLEIAERITGAVGEEAVQLGRMIVLDAHTTQLIGQSFE